MFILVRGLREANAVPSWAWNPHPAFTKTESPPPVAFRSGAGRAGGAVAPVTSCVIRAVVAEADRAYVKGPEAPAMPEIASSLRPSGRPLLLTAAAVIVGMLVAATSALWAYYGSTVFYDMIVAGLAACF